MGDPLGCTLFGQRKMVDIGDPSGGKIATVEFGKPDGHIGLVFAHANGFNALAYRHVLSPLASDLRLVAFDHRGHGRSTLPPLLHQRDDWNDLARDFAALLDQLLRRPALLVGHSMGATTALLAALKRPHLVHGVLLLDPVLHPALPPSSDRPIIASTLRRRTAFPSRDIAIQAYRGRGAFRTWPDSCLADYVADGFRDEPSGGVDLVCPPEWEASNYMATANDGWKALKDATCPIRILRAEEGSVCRLPKSLLTAVEATTVPGTTHFLPFEKPALVRAEIKRMLTSTSITSNSQMPPP